jgi:Transcriptional regulator, AbiEi antitoxin
MSHGVNTSSKSRRAPRRRHDWIDAELREAASKQFGIVDMAVIRRLGIKRTSIDRRVAVGLLIRCHRGVYRYATSSPTDRQRIAAARLAVGTSAVAMARSAAVLHGLKVPFALDIAVTPTKRISVKGVNVFRLAFHPDDVVRIFGISVTSVARTVVDLAMQLKQVELESLVDEVLSRRAATMAELVAATGRCANQSGVARLKLILVGRPGGTALFRSQWERELHACFEAAGLGGIPNYRIVDAEGTERFLDRAWPDQGIALEFDTFVWHTGKKAWAADRHRANASIALGWRIVVATDADLDDRFRRPIESVRALLGR